MSHPGEGPPRQVFMWCQPGKGNYYQNKPDGQPLRMFSHHIPHHRAWTNTTTRVPSKHSSPSPAPMHAPLMRLHFLSTQWGRRHGPKDNGGQTGRQVIEAMGAAVRHEATQRTRRRIGCACFVSAGNKAVLRLENCSFECSMPGFLRHRESWRAAHLPIAGSWGSSLNTAGWHKEEGAASPA